MSRQYPASALGPTGGLDLVFPLDTMNGPLQDPTSGRVLFLISTPVKLIGKGSTTVSLPDGTGVASIDWGGLFEGKTVTFHGQTRPMGQVLIRKKKPGKLIWVDHLGSETYAWGKGLIYSPQKQVVGRYTRGKKPLIRHNEPATLQVDNNHLHLIDRFLIAAIIIEHARRESERSSSGGGGGGGGGFDGGGGGGGDGGGGGGDGGGGAC